MIRSLADACSRFAPAVAALIFAPIACGNAPPAETPTIVLGTASPVTITQVAPVPEQCPSEKWKQPSFERRVLRISPDDPLAGVFGLDDALRGLPGRGAIVATINTTLGALECSLLADRAPN